MLLENCIQIIPIRRGHAVPKELSFLSLLLIVQALVKKEWNSALGSSSPVFSKNVSEILACWSWKATRTKQAEVEEWVGCIATMYHKMGGIFLIIALSETHINSVGSEISYR